MQMLSPAKETTKESLFLLLVEIIAPATDMENFAIYLIYTERWITV